MTSYIYVLGFVIVALGLVSAVTDEEREAMRTAAQPIIDSCIEEYGISKDDLAAAKKTENFDGIDSCYFACFFKKAGMIDENGKFDVETTQEKNKKYIKGEEDLAKLAVIRNTCASVNDQEVGDGDKGCERSKLLLSCFLKEKADLTLFTSV